MDFPGRIPGSCIFDLQSADYDLRLVRSFFFYKVGCVLFLSFVLVFTNGEYRIDIVDFICSSRGAVEERQGISIPYPSPTPLLTPLGIRCGGAFWLPRLTGI